MKGLIEALTIFAKYKNVDHPTHCEHDVLSIMAVTLDEVSEEDRNKLNHLGFLWNSSAECWQSSRYGSA